MLSRDAARGGSIAIGSMAGGDARDRIEAARRLGCRAVHLDAMLLKPRDLDRSARRDLAAYLRRAELAVTGWDLIIPAAHWADPARVDRAVAATLAAIDLADEIRRLWADAAGVVCIDALEAEDPRGTLLDHARARVVRLGQTRWPVPEIMDAFPSIDDLPDPPADLAGLVGRLVGVRWRGRRFEAGAIRGVLAVAGVEAPPVVDLPAGSDAGRVVAEFADLWAR